MASYVYVTLTWRSCVIVIMFNCVIYRPFHFSSSTGCAPKVCFLHQFASLINFNTASVGDFFTSAVSQNGSEISEPPTSWNSGVIELILRGFLLLSIIFRSGVSAIPIMGRSLLRHLLLVQFCTDVSWTVHRWLFARLV